MLRDMPGVSIEVPGGGPAHHHQRHDASLGRMRVMIKGALMNILLFCICSEGIRFARYSCKLAKT